MIPYSKSPQRCDKTSLPNVLMVGNFLSSSGGSRGVCEELAIRLSSSGHRVITTSSRRPRILRLADILTTIWRTRRQYEVAQIDVYSGPAFLLAETSAFLLRRLAKPFVVTLHGGNLPTFYERNPQRVARLLQSAMVVTAPSSFLAKALAPACRRIQILPNAIDIARYNFRPRSSLQPRIAWLRAFHRIYDPVGAVKVLNALKPTHPGVQMTLIGPDKSDGSMEEVLRYVEANELSECTRFVGQVPKHEVPMHLSSADIFLNTTTIDNSPVSLVEAMACGLCVVSTNVGGIPDLVRNEEHALLIPARDPAEGAKSINRVLAQPELAHRMIQSARTLAERHDWSQVLPEWQRILRDSASWANAEAG